MTSGKSSCPTRGAWKAYFHCSGSLSRVSIELSPGYPFHPYRIGRGLDRHRPSPARQPLAPRLRGPEPAPAGLRLSGKIAGGRGLQAAAGASFRQNDRKIASILPKSRGLPHNFGRRPTSRRKSTGGSSSKEEPRNALTVATRSSRVNVRRRRLLPGCLMPSACLS